MTKRRYTEDKPTAVMDTECYRNYWCIGFKCTETGRRRRFRIYKDEKLLTREIAKIFRKRRVISFNGIKYDMPMIALAMSGATTQELKEASDELIQTDIPHWIFMRERGLTLPDFIDHVDLMQVSPGAPGIGDYGFGPSLKLYGGRLHSKEMRDLPIEHSKTLTPDEVTTLEEYHDNDLDVTDDFWKELQTQVKLRSIMSDEYGVDVRSKSDAQVAEAVIKSELEKLLGRKIRAPEPLAGKFKYVAPKYIKFKTPTMREVLRQITSEFFYYGANLKVREPEFLENLVIPFGESNFRMGIGGLHSCESKSSKHSDDDFVLLDRDVTSYYPSIILMLKLFPKHLGAAFLKVFQKIYDRRLHAKAMGKKFLEAGNKEAARPWLDLAETLKIVLNGTFGKLGNAFSIMASVDLMIAVTITGQLSILMLIEDLWLRGMQVVSANTDGFITQVPREELDLFHAMIFDWECDTGLETEETEYRSVYSQSVNAYLAITKEGEAKRKGKTFTPAGPGLKGASGMKKNPFAQICADAVIAYLRDKVPLADTINDCYDIRKFLVVGRVSSGATKDGEYVAKSLRWYYSTETKSPLISTTNKKVGRSEGAKPCLRLPEEFPDDIDYKWYLREAAAILQDFGFDIRDPALAGRRGTAIGRLDVKQKTFHTINLSTGISVCGKEPKSIRDSWVETKSIPAGHRMCAKCIKGGDL